MNTVVSGFMEHTNNMSAFGKQLGGMDRETMDSLIIMLAPFAPHMAEELWEMRGNTCSVFAQSWPTFDESLTKSDTVELALQINGKLRGQLEVAADADKEAVLAEAGQVLAKWLEGAAVVKEIYVPGRIVNIVVKQ